MEELRKTLAQVAPTTATVLLTGESGTGKERVARQIHEQSPRAKARFVALNCAAVPEQLIESELFGFEKGAFTGAVGAKEGLFEAASGGTLLLDEIGDMPIALQAKLLRTLQEGETRRLGATAPRKVDVRVIAATHRDLRENVRAGTFREDLLYRLEVIGIHVPRLRDRMEDVPDLAYHFLRSAAQRHGKEVSGISEEAMAALLAHAWPGNVRELSNVIERAVVFARQPHVQAEDLPPHLAELGTKARAAEGAQAGGAKQASGATSISVPLGTPLKDVEDLLIRKTLEATSGDKNMTAKLLGINSRTIYRKLEKS
jgi:DNA-binding NtrC family response regulator